MKILSILMVLFFSMNTLAHHDSPSAHLTFKDGELHAHVDFLTTPTIGKDSPIQISFRRASDHAPIEISDKIKVVLWMPDMNHGSAPTKTTKIENQLGLYKATNVYFTMDGLWDIRILLTNNEGIVETQSFEIYLGSGHHH